MVSEAAIGKVNVKVPIRNLTASRDDLSDDVSVNCLCCNAIAEPCSGRVVAVRAHAEVDLVPRATIVVRLSFLHARTARQPVHTRIYKASTASADVSIGRVGWVSTVLPVVTIIRRVFAAQTVQTWSAGARYEGWNYCWLVGRTDR